MSTFIVLAAIMLVASILLLVLPVLRAAKSAGEDESPHAWPVAILVVILVPIGAIEVYRSVSTWNWQMPEGPAHAAGVAGADQAASLEEATRTLEERLRNEPGDVEGWVMLGRTYMVIGRFDDAAGALKKAVDLTGGEDPAILGQYAEALTVADQDRLVTETGPIFESLLEIDPADQRGLFYGGMYAYAQERYEVARERWESLQAMNPPESVRPIIDQRLLMVYEKLGVHPPGVVEKTPAMAAAEAAAQSPSTPVPAPAPAPALSGDDVIQLRVEVADGLGRGKDFSRASLFVFARHSAGVGPPLAVVRRSAGELPLDMTLSDQNAMTQGTSLTDIPELQLVARVSFSGGPAASTGDLQGKISFTWDDSGNPVNLVIDEVVP